MRDHAIAFYFDFVSPYACLAVRRLEEIAARHGRPVDWHPVLLGVLVTQVMGLKPLPETPLKGPYVKHDIDRLAAFHGVPLRHHGLPRVSSVAALRAFAWIKEQDAGAAVAFAKAVFHQLWVEGRDIGSPDDLAGPAAAAGVAHAALVEDCGSQRMRQVLKDAVDAAVARGVFGVPFFRADGEAFWGGDRLPMLDHWLAHGRWDAPAPGGPA